MATKQDELDGLVRAALNPLVEQVTHPERFFASHSSMRGMRISQRLLEQPYASKHGNRPLEPRYRLAAGLQLLVALKTFERDLLRELRADTEAIEDVRAHKDEDTSARTVLQALHEP